MPKKRIITNNEPAVSVRPHRNMKAKVVFDPSDNHIPKKRAKYSFKNDKPVEASTTKKTTIDRRRKQGTTKTKIIPVNQSLDCSSSDINNISPIHSPINSPVKSPASEVPQEISNICFACSKYIQKEELVDCPICLTGAHRHCLIVNEPIWKFKLDLCPWLCKQCRKQHCSKCLKDELQSEVQRRCISCEVGLHTSCYESYDIKPLHKLESDVYICIPCMTLATQKMPEEDDDDVNNDDDDDDDDDDINDNNIDDNNIDDNNIENDINKGIFKLRTLSIVSISSEEDDTDLNSFQSYTSSEEEEAHHNIPNTIKWDKEQIFDYLKEHLSQEIIDQLINFDLDGRTLHLLQRKDILKMGLKLGHALSFYKHVRILQSQSTYSRILWE